MKEKPTVFQLAQLAAQAAPHTARPKDAVRRAMELWGEAELTVAESENRAEYLRSLFQTPGGKEIAIFADSPEDWNARLKSYPGDQRDVERAMWDRTFPAGVVAKYLFRDRTLSNEARRKLLIGLARASIRLDMEGPLVPHKGRLNYLEGGGFVAPEEGFPIHPKNLELARAKHRGAGEMLIPGREAKFVKEVEGLLSQPNLYAYLVRWAVDVRHRQLQEGRSRLIPESLQNQDGKASQEDSIQFKRTFRQ
jgi:hypothetical protein